MNPMLSPPNKTGSAPDLRAKVPGEEQSSRTLRKRKHEGDMKDFRDEIMSLLTKVTEDQNEKFRTSLLAAITETQNEKFNSVINSIADLKLQNEEIINSNRKIIQEHVELQRLAEHTSERCDDHDIIIKTLEAKSTKVDALEMEVSHLKNSLEECRKLQHQNEQWSRLHNLEISGIPEKRGENPLALVLNVARHAGVDLQPSDIEFATRVQAMQSASSSSYASAASAATVRPRNIVLKLKSRLLKDSILSGLRKKKGVSTMDIGIEGDTRKVFVNEHLTPPNKLLYKQCRIRAKDKNYAYTWIKNCKIFIRKNDGSPFIYIATTADLNKII